MNADRLLIHAIEALHDGNREVAGVALARILRQDPANLFAWLWLSRAVDAPDRQRYCIERMLAIDPTSEDALEELGLLGARAVPAALENELVTPEGIFSVHLYVAGIPHEGRADVVRRLHLRQPIVLRRETGIADDPHAVRLETATGEIFGFVPQDAARLLAPYMDCCQSALDGVVNELFTSSHGEHIRAGITLFLPAEQAALHDALDKLQTEKIEIAYWFEQTGDTIDLMLDCTEDIFHEIREWLNQCPLDITAFGTPYRLASDGCNYPWYVQLSQQQANQEQIRKHLEKHYRIRPTAAELALLNQLFELSDSESGRKESELRAANDKIGWLNQEVERLKVAGEERRGIALDLLYQTVSDHLADGLSPEQILHLLAQLFPDRLVILDSAYDSSRRIPRFHNSGRAFELLWKLGTEYFDLMQSGHGHRALIDDLFGGDTYAARDDTSSDYYRKVRTFCYAGTDLFMPEHLKIGVAHDSTVSLRIHFKWLNDEGKVVIGYCGKHLPQQA